VSVIPFACGKGSAILMPIKDLDAVFLSCVAIGYHGNGIRIKPILLSYAKLAKQLTI
jgi:hypothetical protein